MKEKIYHLMNWAKIEGIVYAEEDCPGTILGPQAAGSSILYQAFFPDAEKVTLILEEKNKRVPMDLADEAGFFAALAAGKKVGAYSYEVVTKDGDTVIRKDPYAYSPDLTPEDLERFQAGTDYEVYQKLGSHEKEIAQTKGIQFAVWVPGAVRVSILGDFNRWDGSASPMNRIGDSDVFALFLPELDTKVRYQYEVKARDGSISILLDPYADREVTKEQTFSIPHTGESFSWKDKRWMDGRKKKVTDLKVFAWEEGEEKDAGLLAKNLKAQEFSYISLPAFYFSGSFYQMTDSFENANAVKQFVQEMHKAGIGVLFNWNSTSCHELYKKQVSNFFLANVLYWVEEFHMDGLIFSALADLLYLDYGKKPGQWQPNVFGGNENLEGVEFIKHTNSILMQRHPGFLLLADIDAIWPKVTAALEEGGLGFHYRYDTDFTRDLLQYLTTEPMHRPEIHEKITSRMAYAYHEKFVMAFPANTVHDLWERLPGEEEEKFSTIKAAFAYLSFLPGKLISGFQVPAIWKNEYAALVKKCHECNTNTDILAKEDYNFANFSWLNCFQQKECTVSFLRKNAHEEGSLLIAANFAEDEKREFRIGVPYEGKYELIFTTEETIFGGKISLHEDAVFTQEQGWDGYAQEIQVTLPALSVSVYRYIPFTAEEIYEMAEKKAAVVREQILERARQKVERLKGKERRNG